MIRHVRRLALAIAGAGGLAAAGMAAWGAVPVSASYGSGAQYQVEISSNPPGTGFWIWAELGPNTSSDYQETDCIHLGGGHVTDAAAHDSGSLTSWSDSGGWLRMIGMNVIANQATANIAVAVGPSGYGQINGMYITFTSWNTAALGPPPFPLNVPLPFPATGVVAP